MSTSVRTIVPLFSNPKNSYSPQSVHSLHFFSAPLFILIIISLHTNVHFPYPPHAGLFFWFFLTSHAPFPHAIILIFSVPKSLYSNIMKKRKIMLVTMATPISSHVKDKNSIFTARDEDMIF